ncbi:MAG: hypothetical protein JO322_06580 [Candidatus Eremiobacteraeota bacterium]|nr:hypothetical protein [Candidatus Eremiobacteraeota bacterium]
MGSPSSVFSEWAAFYTLTGSSAAALTGLTFVVITLLRDSQRRAGTGGIARVSAATVAHFTAALMISGILLAPWPMLLVPCTLLAAAGAAGVSYQCRLLVYSLRFSEYTPDAEDWTWYTFLPMFAYAVILGSAVALSIAPQHAMYAPAAGVALLILVGIHNSWDIVTYITISDPASGDKPS